ncbi:MAG: hypothetical protein ABL929_02555 [Ferruginibacter sp.]|nr:hypothetical protein [Ferruginibacter sp.]
MKKIIPFVILLLFFAACKKPKVKDIQTNNSVDSLTYQPKVPGSRWTYTRTILLNNTNYNYERLATDTVHLGNTYNVFYSDVDGAQYLRQDGDKYYNVLTASTNKPPLLVLDASKNINESWVGGVNGSDTYTYTIKEKIPIFVLDGFTFKNVIKVYQTRTTTSGSTTLAGDTYYAQGVGMIKTEGTVSGIPVTIKLIYLDLK